MPGMGCVGMPLMPGMLHGMMPCFLPGMVPISQPPRMAATILPAGNPSCSVPGHVGSEGTPQMAITAHAAAVAGQARAAADQTAIPGVAIAPMVAGPIGGRPAMPHLMPHTGACACACGDGCGASGGSFGGVGYGGCPAQSISVAASVLGAEAGTSSKLGEDTKESNDSHTQMEMWAAAAAAQQTQYMQQYQFYQQLRVQEVQQRRAKTATSAPSRFKENFRPMRICKHLITLGMCRQGADCTFAHNYDELHPASPDLPKEWKEAGTSGETAALAAQGEVEESKVPDMRLKKKKEMCGRFSRGECSLGKICPFAHTEAELGTVGLAVCGKVKTRLCVFWDASSGTATGCIYGANCNNAHGEWEIGTKRPPPELAPPMKRRREGESVIANRA